MGENSIRALHKRRFKATTSAKHSMPVADNMLNPHFTSEAPNMRWARDITDIPRAEGWLYLAAAGINNLGRRVERMALPLASMTALWARLVLRSRR